MSSRIDMPIALYVTRLQASRGVSGRLAGLALAVFVLSTSSCGYVQSDANPSDQLRPDTPPELVSTDIAFDSARGVGLMAVASPEGSQGNRGQLAQRVDATGRLVGLPVVLSSRPENASGGEVAFNATANEYLVVWQTGPSTASRFPFSARRVTRDGTPIGTGSFPIGGRSARSTGDLAAGDKMYALGYSDGGRVYTRILDALGHRVRDTRVSRRNERRTCAGAAVAYRQRTRGFLTGFTCGIAELDAGPSPQTRYVQGLNRSGIARGGPVPVVPPRQRDEGNGTTSLAYSPRDDHFLFVSQARGRLVTRVLRGDGTPTSPVRRLTRSRGRYEVEEPVAASDPASSSYLVVWQSDRRVDASRRAPSVFGAHVSRSGLDRRPSFLVFSFSANFLALASKGPARGYLVAATASHGPVVQEVSGFR